EVSVDRGTVHGCGNTGSVVSVIHGAADALVTGIQKDDGNDDRDNQHRPDDDEHRPAAALLGRIFFDPVLIHGFDRPDADVLFGQLLKYRVQEIGRRVGGDPAIRPG